MKRNCTIRELALAVQAVLSLCAPRKNPVEDTADGVSYADKKLKQRVLNAA